MVRSSIFTGPGKRPGPELHPEDAHYAERLLAVARLYLLAFVAAVVGLDRLSFPAESWMLLGYGAEAVAIFIALRRIARVPPALAWTIHILDLLWAAAFMAGNMAVGCVLFVFAMVGAAHRWDRRETLQSAALGFVAIVGAASAAALLGRPFAGSENPLAHESQLWLGLVVLVPAAIIGLVVGEDKRLRVEAAVVSQAMAHSRQEHGIRDTLLAVFGDLLGYLGGDDVVLAVADKESNRAYRWHMTTAKGKPTLHYTELEDEERADFLFETPPGACLVRRRVGRRGEEWREQAANPAVRGLELPRLLKGFAQRHPFEDALIAADAIETWNGRLFVLGGSRSAWGEPEMRFLERFFSYITPVIHNAYLLRRLRTRIGALERARVARDLHDGVIQSLFGLELRVDALRRKMPDTEVAEELGGVQMQIRQELAALRELMAQMKPLELRPEQLIDYLADYVERFGRDTGIHSSFMSNVEEVHLPARTCNDIARVIQEALVNVRKHSGARNLLVRLTQTGGRLTIVVDDDGRGFGFSGHYSHRDLEQQRKGPWVIKERLRAIGGELTLDTGPGQGARLEIGIR
jgi:signal transduction histidine kinase